MIAVISWGMVGLLLGILVFVAAPLLAAMVDDSALGDRYAGAFRAVVSAPYFAMSMKSYDRVLAEISPHNDLSLRATSFDDSDQAESVPDGEREEKYADGRGVSARLKGRPLRLGFSNSAFTFHPLDAIVGRALDRIDTEGRRWQEFEVNARTDGGRRNGDTATRTVVAHSAHAALPDSNTLEGLNLQHAWTTMVESHDPGDMYKTERHVEKSQAGYTTRDYVEMAGILIACGAGALAAWVIYSNTGNAESSVTLPSTILLVGVRRWC